MNIAKDAAGDIVYTVVDIQLSMSRGYGLRKYVLHTKRVLITTMEKENTKILEKKQNTIRNVKIRQTKIKY